MRHRNSRIKISHGSSSFRRALLNSLVQSLIEHGRIQTTQPRAKILKSVAEKLVTKVASLGEVLLKDYTKLDDSDKARIVNTKRLVRKAIKNEQTVDKLFSDVGPRFIGRPGGYTRMFKTGPRKGDNAPMAIIEFVPSALPSKETASSSSEGKSSQKK